MQHDRSEVIDEVNVLSSSKSDTVKINKDAIKEQLRSVLNVNRKSISSPNQRAYMVNNNICEAIIEVEDGELDQRLPSLKKKVNSKSEG